MDQTTLLPYSKPTNSATSPEAPSLPAPSRFLTLPRKLRYKICALVDHPQTIKYSINESGSQFQRLLQWPEISDWYLKESAVFASAVEDLVRALSIDRKHPAEFSAKAPVHRPDTYAIMCLLNQAKTKLESCSSCSSSTVILEHQSKTVADYLSRYEKLLGWHSTVGALLRVKKRVAREFRRVLARTVPHHLDLDESNLPLTTIFQAPPRLLTRHIRDCTLTITTQLHDTIPQVIPFLDKIGELITKMKKLEVLKFRFDTRKENVLLEEVLMMNCLLPLYTAPDVNKLESITFAISDGPNVEHSLIQLEKRRDPVTGLMNWCYFLHYNPGGPFSRIRLGWRQI